MNTTNMEQVTIRELAKEKVKILSKHNSDYFYMNPQCQI